MDIKNHFLNHQLVTDSFLNNDNNFDSIRKAADFMLESINKGGTIFSCGNGGSMCDAMHFAQELSGYFNKKISASNPTIYSPGTKLPFSSKKKQRSKSPSNAMPRSALFEITKFLFI